MLRRKYFSFGIAIQKRKFTNNKATQAKCLGIRRETVNAWERRAPLAPHHVAKLTKKGVRVLVQPSNRRAYPISNIRLIDYEKLVDANKQRLVAFGKYAGYAGLINILHGLGLRLLALGHHTPFLHIGQSHNYRDCHMAVNALRDAGYEIALDMMPRSLGPLIFVFTGTGNVSQGAQELFQNLPHEYVSVKSLPKVAKFGSKEGTPQYNIALVETAKNNYVRRLLISELDRLYACVVGREEHLIKKNGGRFDAAEYEQEPHLYSSTFAFDVAPYANVIINGIFWAVNSPRLLSIPEAKILLSPSPKRTLDTPGCPTLPHRLIAICDISADPGGSIEFVTECTTIDRPFCIYDADQNKNTDNFDSESGVLVCSIDNMPAQLPNEATKFFGDLLLPYIDEMLESDASRPFKEYNVSQVVSNAVITSNGKLTPNFEYIADMRRHQQIESAHKAGRLSGENSRRVLLLGAGFVSGPVVDYLNQDKKIFVTVASERQDDFSKIEDPTVETVVLDVVDNHMDLDMLVSSHDLVISLLPYALHPLVAKKCIQHRKDMVTSSYLLPEMAELNHAALEAGITVVSEAGLDPGIDHMLAMECIDKIHERGGKVTSFISYCGGLPAPENSQNPLRYKFNWSPKGVLLALLNPTKFLQDGDTIETPPDGGVLDMVTPMSFMPGFNLVGYPNRDSTIYAKLYGIETAKTVLRGTLRYKGFAESFRGLKELGLIDRKPNPLLNPHSGPDITWKQFIATLWGERKDVFPDSLTDLIENQFGKDSFEFNSILEYINNVHPMSDVRSSAAFRKKLPLEGAIGRSFFQEACHSRIRLMEIHHVDLVNYGKEVGHSAMARCVGYTAAIVAKMILTGEIQKKGMVLPMTKDIYRPVLRRLSKLGITARTRSRWVE